MSKNIGSKQTNIHFQFMHTYTYTEPRNQSNNNNNGNNKNDWIIRISQIAEWRGKEKKRIKERNDETSKIDIRKMLHQSFFLLLLLLSVYGHFIHNFSTDRIFFFLLVFVSSAESLSKVNYETRNKRRKKREKHTRGKIRKTVGNKKSCIFHKRQSTKEKESRKKERKRSEITKRYGCSLFGYTVKLIVVSKSVMWWRLNVYFRNNT